MAFTQDGKFGQLTDKDRMFWKTYLRTLGNKELFPVSENIKGIIQKYYL